MYPLKSRWTKTRWSIILFGIWLVAFGLSSVQFVYTTAKEFQWDKAVLHSCDETFSNEGGKFYTMFVFLSTFAIPLVILGFAYASIGWKIWKHSSPGNADVERDQHQLQTKRKAIKMLALIVALFAFCWLPLQTYMLFLFTARELISKFSEENMKLNSYLFLSCHWLAMANSFLNPIIYCFMSENFWDDLRQIIFGCSHILNIRKKRAYDRGRCLGSFRSTTLVLSFRTNSAGSCQGAVYMKKMSGNSKSLNYCSTVKYSNSENV